MHHTAHLALIFGFYRDTVAVITHGNDCILQKGTVNAVYHGSQLAMDFSLVDSLERRILFNLGLASSAISSSDKIQRLISLASCVIGVSPSK